MKKTILFLALAAIVASCDPKNDPKAFQIKDTDMISIRPTAGTANAPAKVKATEGHLTALEIVKQADGIFTPDFERSFTNAQRDTVSITPKLLMWATDVITLEGVLQTEDNTGWIGWIDAKDVVIIRYTLPNWQGIDTIAYIPNTVLRTAETAIREAYAAKDIEACYTIFNTAYTFTPITGAEWRALKASGQN